MKFKNYSIFITVLFFCFKLFASDGSLSISAKLSPVGSFTISGEKIKITGAEQSGEKIKVKKISIRKADLSTGIDLRDEHMREKIKDKVISVTNIKAKSGRGIGQISINGKKKKIKFTYKKDDNKVEAKFDLELSHFGIEGINYLGVGLQDKVKLKINLNLP